MAGNGDDSDTVEFENDLSRDVDGVSKELTGEDASRSSFPVSFVSEFGVVLASFSLFDAAPDNPANAGDLNNSAAHFGCGFFLNSRINPSSSAIRLFRWAVSSLSNSVVLAKL